MLKRMSMPVCPMDVDQPIFSVTLEVWHGHEDYLLTRVSSEVLSYVLISPSPTCFSIYRIY
ncbi:unnamed protein product [Protopolystoma xenopodis]|uniref:Uncharacterized protein n=1 Tax=Protopolystoma xenopodis TaxID=117903 RepID=A0A3S5CQE3_9PLAT|nr:unnamed protein product [Protopolystoma xenopodis]